MSVAKCRISSVEDQAISLVGDHRREHFWCVRLRAWEWSCDVEF